MRADKQHLVDVDDQNITVIPLQWPAAATDTRTPDELAPGVPRLSGLTPGTARAGRGTAGDDCRQVIGATPSPSRAVEPLPCGHVFGRAGRRLISDTRKRPTRGAP